MSFNTTLQLEGNTALELFQWMKDPYYLSILVVSIVGYLLLFSRSNSKEAKIPFVGLHLGSVAKRRETYVKDANSLLNEGYKKMKNGIFQMTTTEGTRIVAGQKFYHTLCEFNDDELSFEDSIADLFATHYTGVLIADENKEMAIQRYLTPNISRLTPKTAEEVDYALSVEMPPCPDWTPVTFNRVSQRTIARMVARQFVGLDLCRDEAWLKTSVDYWMDAFFAAKTIKFIPVPLRKVAAFFLPQVRRMKATRAEAQRLVVPLLKKRLEAQKQPGYEKPDDAMQWIMDRLGDRAEKELHYQAHLQLALAMGGVHSSSFTLLQMLFDLAAYPEYQDPLRDEFAKALESTGGELTRATINQLSLMDSFMKESQRCAPPGLTNGRRKILKDLRLPDGTILPKGADIEICANAVNQDGAIYPNPEEFDPWRFHRLRQGKDENEGDKYQFVSINKDSLNWGYGRHACPGRFVAANSLKIITNKILQKYEVKQVDTKEPRCKNEFFETMVVPDMQKQLMFRERK